MASKLTQNHKLLLTDTLFDRRVGTRPYEGGIWGTHSDRDFAFVELLDQGNNLIESKNMSFNHFVTEDGYVKFYPGTHIRSFGYQSGIFNVRYNFLRKMAGDESTVLLHTIDKTDTKIGDIYTNTNNIYITDDGIVYIGDEENYKNNPTTTEQLKLEDLKYLIDEISSDRTEVRLKAKKINGSYIDEFTSIQTTIKIEPVEHNISFQSQNNEDLYDSTTLQLTLPSEFAFKSHMVNGTMVIPEVFKVNEIQTPARTNINALNNPNGEFLENDTYGNVVTLGETNGWDASLHNKAVNAVDWSSGYLNFGDSNDDFFGTSAIGYHAFWVQKEGVVGGVCMKFTDMNEPFNILDEWPAGQAYRKLRISQEMPNLQGQGISHSDLINIRCDIRSTVSNKGVQMSIHYSDSIMEEPKPIPAPAGYFNPENPGPSEIKPQDAPAGYVVNTPGAASLVEPQPSNSEMELRTLYPTLNQVVPDKFPLEGHTTALWGGAGAWVVKAHVADDDPDYIQWKPNIEENLLIGTFSIEQQWEWDGYKWVPGPGYQNFPIAPDGTVRNLKAVNHHAYQAEGEGRAKYPRNTKRGENAGWQTGTQRGSDKYLLFKDDLVWEGKAGQNNDTDLELKSITQWFGSIFWNKSVIGEDGVARSLHDDIFENGFIQTVTRANTTDTGEAKVRTDHYIIFYNDGRGNAETSNKWFQIKRGNSQFQHGQSVSYLKDLSPLINSEVNANDLKFEVTFWRHTDDKQFRYYWAVADRVHRSRDGNGNISNDSFTTDSDYPGPISNKFGYLEEVPDAWFPKDPTNSDDWSRFSAIVGETYYKGKTNISKGASETKSLQEVFYNAGIMLKQGVNLTYGVRNPGAVNYGVHDDVGAVVDSETEPIYQIPGRAIYNFDNDPSKDGTLSEFEMWRWNGTAAEWEANNMVPVPLNFKTTNAVENVISPGDAGQWQTHEISIPVPGDMLLDKPWYLYINGDGVSSFNQNQGVVWVDNLFLDFTLRNQSVTEDVRRPYTAQILEVLNQGTIIRVDKSFKQRALDLGVEDSDPTTDTVYDVETPSTYGLFKVTYTNQNPYDLRSYLKFDNDMF